MKMIKKYIITSLLFLISIHLFSQDHTCPVIGLANDITDKNLGNSVKNFLDNNEKGMDVWLFMFDAFQRNRVFTKDESSLTMLKNLLEDASFTSKMGDNLVDDLSKIIDKNKILHCNAAGTASGYGALYSTFPEFLDEFRYLVNNFDISQSGAQQFYQWAKRMKINNTAMSKEGLPIIAEMYQTLYILKKKGLKGGDIVSFGGKFAKGDNKFDLLTNLGKYIELKNVDFVKYSLKKKSQVIDQLINGYFKNINSLDELEWIASLKKLKAKGWADHATALTNMKKQFKEMFQHGDNAKNAFEVIWANQNLRTSLFGTIPINQLNILKNSKKKIFNNWIETLDDKLYKFINIE